MKRIHAATAIVCLGLAACSEYKTKESRDVRTDTTVQTERTDVNRNERLEDTTQMGIQDFRDTDPTLSRFFDNSIAYAVFPEITKGGAGLGAAHGEGVLYEHGVATGYVTLWQGTIGAQLGGQKYRELIFFQRQIDVDNFKAGKGEFSAQASAVAAAKGAAANADYSNGVAIFTRGLEGLMGEASVGGQKFTFHPKR